MFEWDEKKRKANVAKHNIDFETVWDFDWEHSVRYPDLRKEYGEDRFFALAHIEDRLHACVYTIREDNYRIISLRKANQKEVSYYAKEFY
jgi:uncharacterized DUF497 family protein